ncbi:N-acetylglucosamine kinase [Streptomyces apocyni]|uniref:N-acetylglucosamine kinase n=1 Tax=Streptomyces apocyni TaxID=2654677 RepID=UPI0012EA6A03|nr:BadF/BadG/BcrA/BcrD ATPase family protein [Streptomyces apocyni]
MRSRRHTPEGDGGPSCVLGVDSGGSGLRVALGVTGGGLRQVEPVMSREPVRTGSGGIDADHLLEQLTPMAAGLIESAGGGGGTVVEAVVIGAAGMATLGGELRAKLPSALTATLGVRRLALAADAVTAYAGALGQRPGAVVAAGTGMVALGTDLTRWRRADGWGHLLGDCGSGAWIGRAGLEAALRAYDGRRGGSRALLARARETFGPVSELPGQLYPRGDRPAVLASFAPSVAECAAHDRVAAGILAAAARHIAEAAAAVCPAPAPVLAPDPAPDPAPDGSDEPPEVAFTGGLFRLGEPLLVPLRAELAEQLPHARLVPAAGDPLDGAVRIALDLAGGGTALPPDPHLLYIPKETDS